MKKVLLNDFNFRGFFSYQKVVDFDDIEIEDKCQSKKNYLEAIFLVTNRKVLESVRGLIEKKYPALALGNSDIVAGLKDLVSETQFLDRHQQIPYWVQFINEEQYNTILDTASKNHVDHGAAHSKDSHTTISKNQRMIDCVKQCAEEVGKKLKPAIPQNQPSLRWLLGEKAVGLNENKSEIQNEKLVPQAAASNGSPGGIRW